MESLENDFSVLCEDHELICDLEDKPDNPAKELVMGELSERWGHRYITSEGLMDDMKAWFSERISKLEQKYKRYAEGLEGYKRRYEKLPDQPLLNEAEIKAFGWSIALYSKGKVDLDHVLKFAHEPKTLEGSARKEIISYDFSSPTRMSAMDADGLSRREVNVTDARALIAAGKLSLYVGKDITTFVLPTSVLVCIEMNRDGTQSVKYGSAPVSKLMDIMDAPFKKLYPEHSIDMTIPALSKEEYKKVKSALSDFITGYSKRLKEGGALTNAINDLYDKMKDEGVSQKDKRIVAKKLKAMLDVEDAMTLSIKRSITVLLEYAERSQM